MPGHTRTHTDTEKETPMRREFCSQGGRGVEVMLLVPVRPMARRATNMFWGGGMLRGAVLDSSHVVSGPSRTRGHCVLKEELEWRRGGVQSARVE